MTARRPRHGGRQRGRSEGRVARPSQLPGIPPGATLGDADTNRIRRLASERFPVVLRNWVASVTNRLWEELDPAPCSGGYLEAEPAEVFLDQFRQLIESEARAIANLMHPAEWLWWIRRLPDDIFAGQLASTGVYDRSLAAVLSAGSNKATLSASFRPPHPRGYVTDGTLSTVLDLAALAVIASQSHVLLRYVGKGARLEVREGDFPEVRPDPKISASIRRFDSRMERSHRASMEFHFFGPAGTRTLTGVTNVDDPTVMLTAVPASRELVDTTFGSALLGQVEVPVKVWADYRLVLLSAEQLATLTGEPALFGAMWWEDALPSLLVFLRTMWLAVPYMTGDLPGLYNRLHGCRPAAAP